MEQIPTHPAPPAYDGSGALNESAYLLGRRSVQGPGEETVDGASRGAGQIQQQAPPKGTK